jgi:long-chain acyl-CoA synthetase
MRGTVQRSLVFPALSWAYRVEANGLSNLDGIREPVLLAANHHLHLDNGVLLKVLPSHVRRRLAIAASSHMFRNPARAVAIQFLGNGFPFAKEGPVRPSLENLGRILDEGWSVLVYPEGELTVGGPLKPFKPGIGLVATESRVPVVPLRLDVKRFGWPTYAPLLRRGHVEVRVGRPLRFENGATPEQAAAAIEKAVAAL